jgi:hypothetical protein
MNKTLACGILILLVGIIVLSGCKSAAPVKGEAVSPEEAEIDQGLQDLNDLDQMNKDMDSDPGLDELDKTLEE